MATELEKWEEKLRNVFKEIDHILEEKYGGEFPRNPVRAQRGATSNPESDGLFDVGATYSAGFGSKFGEGYVIETRWATLKPVPTELEKEAEKIVEKVLNDKLHSEFPGKNLKVVRDGEILKIVGDLSLK